jgi:hypothetical protein
MAIPSAKNFREVIMSKYKRWYVVDEDNQTSFSAKAEKAEHFTTKKAAQRRAVHLANTDPGKMFFIAEAVMFADAEVSTATYKAI